jgi:hypothetical protein
MGETMSYPDTHSSERSAPADIKIYLTASEYKQYVKSGKWTVQTEVGVFFADTMLQYNEHYVELSKDQFHVMIPAGFYHQSKLSA